MYTRTSSPVDSVAWRDHLVLSLTVGLSALSSTECRTRRLLARFLSPAKYGTVPTVLSLPSLATAATTGRKH